MKTKELELSEKIERRLEMIHAHTKLEKNYPRSYQRIRCMPRYILLLVSPVCRKGHFWSLRFQKGMARRKELIAKTGNISTRSISFKI